MNYVEFETSRIGTDHKLTPPMLDRIRCHQVILNRYNPTHHGGRETRRKLLNFSVSPC
jgi:hypothetical protein